MSRSRFELIGETFPGVMLWRIDLDVPVQATELACLSSEEQARAARFRAARDRDRYLRAHAATRQLLARHSGDAACELAFVTGEFGKPQLAGALRLHFNLSHSDNAAVLAISDTGAVGVDVEILREIPDASVLAERHFTLVERGELASTPAGQVDRVFLRGWTRKEACLKAVGIGLRLAPSSFDVGLSSAPRQVVLRQPACTLRLASFEDCRGVIGALAQVG